jgi:hypothetical protein
MKFENWLKEKHPDNYNEFFGFSDKSGPKEPPTPPIELINTADFNPSFKDSKGRLYMPHHHYYDVAREIYRKFKKKPF